MNMPKNYWILTLKVIIRESWIFAKSIVTGHSRKFIPEISRIFYFVKLSPREDFYSLKVNIMTFLHCQVFSQSISVLKQ